MNKRKLQKISRELKKASNLHAGQAKKIDSMLKMNKNVASGLRKKTSPALKKLSASCKAAAKRKFKVYPSAYANMWAAKTQRQGKC